MQHYGVAIVGVGSLGRALAFAFAKREDIALRLWDKEVSQVPGQGSLESAVSGADVIFICVSSWGIAKALRDVAPFLSPTTTVVSMTKGIEPEDARFMPELLDKILPQGQTWALMGGPMMAAEIIEGQPSVGVIASPWPESGQKVASLFAGTPVTVETSADVIGLALMGVLKNVYAVGLGIAEGISWEGNACGWYVSQALRECVSIVTGAGGTTETVLGPAGAADLVATGFSRHSRNRTCGRSLAKNGSCPPGSEGYASLEHLLKRLGPAADSHLLLKALASIVVEKKNAREVFGTLLP
jgi:glycerol-3-phosphate dehydrogenase (NAD(P)+)